MESSIIPIIKMGWQEIKEVQTLLAGIFALLAARYAYLHVTKRDREKAKIIEAIAIRRILYVSGTFEALKDVLKVFKEHYNETFDDKTINLQVIIMKELLQKAEEKFVSDSFAKNMDYVLYLSPKQFSKITVLEAQIEALCESLKSLLEKGKDQRFLVKECTKRIIEGSEMLKKSIQRTGHIKRYYVVKTPNLFRDLFSFPFFRAGKVRKVI